MFTNQTLLVIGGLMLVTILILTFFKSNSNHITTSLDNEAVIVGSSIGMSLLEEITIRKFDHNITEGSITLVGNMTAPADLGPEEEDGGTSVEFFNDIDDFHDYLRPDTLSTLGIFNTSVAVHYVNYNAPNDTISLRSYHKRITITIENDYLENPLRLYHVVSY